MEVVETILPTSVECEERANHSNVLEVTKEFIIGLYSGYSEGQKTAIDLFTITINHELLFKTNTMLTYVNCLCHDVNAICVECDQVIEKLAELKITLGDFKPLTSYYVEEENIV